MRRLAILLGLVVTATLVLGRLFPDGAPLLAAEEKPPADAAPATDAAAKPPDAAKPDAAKPDDAESAYAGDETCAACHDEIAASVAHTPHADNPNPAWKGRACEGCHGPGQAHVDGGGDTSLIRSNKPPTPATERSAVCLKCHAGDPRLREVRGGEHMKSGVACAECHDPHGKGTGPHLLRKPPPDLCMSCHMDVRAAFAMPWRHGPREAKIVCMDCHEPHGTRNVGMLKGPNDRTCFTCHADKEGPWVYEHPAVVTEGCQSCHVPHGSANRHLLQYQQVAQLCYQCHTVTPRSHVQPTFRDCTRCHAWIHGSNTDPRFLEP
jgi:DmsE family decaheme c-type cytochrome